MSQGCQFRPQSGVVVHPGGSAIRARLLLEQGLDLGGPKGLGVGVHVTDDILTLLTAAGTTADEVAATLDGHGVRARRGNSSFDNPIVRYLYRHLDVGGRLDIPVGGTSIIIMRAGSWLAVPLPVAVRDFLDHFHSG